MTYLPITYILFPKFFTPLLIFSRSFPEHLKVTTFLGSSVMSPPVAGFLAFRSAFCLTQNLPNPLIRTSSPDASVDLMISRRISTGSAALLRGNPLASAMASIIWTLVSDIFLPFFLLLCERYPHPSERNNCLIIRI